MLFLHQLHAHTAANNPLGRQEEMAPERSMGAVLHPETTSGRFPSLPPLPHEDYPLSTHTSTPVEPEMTKYSKELSRLMHFSSECRKKIKADKLCYEPCTERFIPFVTCEFVVVGWKFRDNFLPLLLLPSVMEEIN